MAAIRMLFDHLLTGGMLEKVRQIAAQASTRTTSFTTGATTASHSMRS
jgi:hypothetical protein